MLRRFILACCKDRARGLAGTALRCGKVVRSADAIDPATRTLRTEIDVPNPKGQLFPGSFAQVHFAVSVPTQRFSVPVNALLFRAEGDARGGGRQR